MALVLTSPARVDPQIGLAQALLEYEAVLDRDQRSRYKATAIVPSADAVISLTSEIDNLSSRRRSRCVATRLVSFLESVQQFSSIVETLVTINPASAALIWGAVKLTLLAASNFSSFFEKVSNLLMVVGSTCPRLVDFGILYPASDGLHKSLYEYYTEAVRLCQKIVEFSKKPGIVQFSKTLFSPFEAQFGPVQKSLERLGRDARDEISLAAKQHQSEEASLQAVERHKNASYRERALGFFAKANHSHEHTAQWQSQLKLYKSRKRKAQFLNKLSTYDYQKAWKLARRPCATGTSTWLCKREEFVEWKRSHQSAILMCTGRLGSGKTVIGAQVVANLVTDEKEAATIYFFCKHDDAASLSPRVVIGTLARQLLEHLPPEAFQLLGQAYLSSTADLDLDQIIELVGNVLRTIDSYIVLDGLDECTETDAKVIVNAIQDLSAVPSNTIRTYFSTRLGTLQEAFPSGEPAVTVAIVEADVKPDIDIFIEQALSEALAEDKLRLGDPALILDIQNALSEGAQGMFLWVVFQIDTLCAQKTDAEIIRTLVNLPRDLGETFNRILQKVAALGEPNVTYVQKIFWWVAMAQEPLTVDQLREALAVEPADLDWDPNSLINDMGQVLAMCGCLVTIDEEYGVVQFTHHSVKQHLLSTIADPVIKDWQILSEQAEKYAGEVCLTYLNSARFEAQIIRMPTVRRVSTITTTGIVNTALSQTSVTKRLAIQLLKAKSRSKSFDHRRIQSIAKSDVEEEPTTQDEFPFRQYASKYWLHHTKFLKVPFRVGSFDVEHLSRRYGEREAKLWRLWVKMIRNDDTLGRAMGFHQSLLYGREALQWIVDHGHQALLGYKMQAGHFDQEDPSLMAAHEALASAILVGSDNGLQEVLLKHFRILTTVLLNKIVIYLAEKGDAGPFNKVWHLVSLEWCVTWPISKLGNHYYTCHEIRISNSCFPYHRTGHDETSGWGPLSIAAAHGRAEICRIIVEPIDESSWDRPTWIYSSEGKNDLCNAFEEAAIHGHLDVALILCSNQWRTKLICQTVHQYYQGWSPLMFAISLGDLELVQSFVGQGVDVAHVAKDYKTAFNVANLLGYREIRRFLVASTNPKDEAVPFDTQAMPFDLPKRELLILPSASDEQEPVEKSLSTPQATSTRNDQRRGSKQILNYELSKRPVSDITTASRGDSADEAQERRLGMSYRHAGCLRHNRNLWVTSTIPMEMAKIPRTWHEALLATEWVIREKRECGDDCVGSKDGQQLTQRGQGHIHHQIPFSALGLGDRSVRAREPWSTPAAPKVW